MGHRLGETMSGDEDETRRDRSDADEPEDPEAEPTDGGAEDTGEIETWPPEEEQGQQRTSPHPSPPEHGQTRREPPRSSGQGARDHQQRIGAMSDADARNWAAGAHLASLIALVGIPSVVGPLIVWLVKRDEHPFVADQATEALNFQISVLIYTVLGVIAALLFTVLTLGLGILVVLPIALIFLLGVLVLPILAAVRASDGERYRYPLTLRLISKPEGPRGQGTWDR